MVQDEQLKAPESATDKNDDYLVSLTEWLGDKDDYEEWRDTVVDGRRWGEWTLRLCRGFLLLVHDSKYEVDLGEIRDCIRDDVDTGRACASALDWIVQIAHKSWATNDTIGDLVRAMDDVFQPQFYVCGWGKCHKGDPNFLEWTCKPKRTSKGHGSQHE